MRFASGARHARRAVTLESPMKSVYARNGEIHTLETECTPNFIEIRSDGEPTPVHLIASDPTRVVFVHDGKLYTARVVIDGKRRWVHYNGKTFVLERGEASTRRAPVHEREGTGSGIVTAPMPGQVRGILVQRGEWVEEGQPLLLLEAMKMEIRVTAPRAGQLVQVDVQVGQSVEREQILARIQEEDE